VAGALADKCRCYVCMYVCMYVCICLSFYLYLSIDLSIDLSIYISIYLSICSGKGCAVPTAMTYSSPISRSRIVLYRQRYVDWCDEDIHGHPTVEGYLPVEGCLPYHITGPLPDVEDYLPVEDHSCGSSDAGVPTEGRALLEGGGLSSVEPSSGSNVVPRRARPSLPDVRPHKGEGRPVLYSGDGTGSHDVHGRRGGPAMLVGQRERELLLTNTLSVPKPSLRE
jgi:hypothetical protein